MCVQSVHHSKILNCSLPFATFLRRMGSASATSRHLVLLRFVSGPFCTIQCRVVWCRFELCRVGVSGGIIPEQAPCRFTYGMKQFWSRLYIALQVVTTCDIAIDVYRNWSETYFDNSACLFHSKSYKTKLGVCQRDEAIQTQTESELRVNMGYYKS